MRRPGWSRPGRGRPSTRLRWLLDMMSLGLIYRYRVATITDPKLLELLQPRPNEVQQYDLGRLKDKFKAIGTLAQDVAEGTRGVDRL